MNRKSHESNGLPRFQSQSPAKKFLQQLVNARGQLESKREVVGYGPYLFLFELDGARPSSKKLFELLQSYLLGEGFTVVDMGALEAGEWVFQVDSSHGDLLNRVFLVGASLVRGCPIATILELTDGDWEQSDVLATLRSLRPYWPPLDQELAAYPELVG